MTRSRQGVAVEIDRVRGAGQGTEREQAIAVCLEQLAPLHARLCPRQVLGVRLGLRAGEILKLDVPRPDKRLLVFAEADGCFADGVSVATGCWFGRRTMRLVDHGKVAATVVDTETGRAVRISPGPRARDLAAHYAPDAPDRWHAQLAGYQLMPDAELLAETRVMIDLPVSDLVGQPGQRVTCVTCGEEVMNGREVDVAERVLCRGCAGDRYWHPVENAEPTGSLEA